MQITGKLIEKSDTEQVTDSFKKREFVIEYAENPDYPELLKFELIQSNCEQLDGVQVGQELSVHFNLKGRKWINQQGESKYFNSLQAWRIESSDKPVHVDTNKTQGHPEWREPDVQDDLAF